MADSRVSDLCAPNLQQCAALRYQTHDAVEDPSLARTCVNTSHGVGALFPLLRAALEASSNYTASLRTCLLQFHLIYVRGPLHKSELLVQHVRSYATIITRKSNLRDVSGLGSFDKLFA